MGPPEIFQELNELVNLTGPNFIANALRRKSENGYNRQVAVSRKGRPTS
jgi:hypothetical protein